MNRDIPFFSNSLPRRGFMRLIAALGAGTGTLRGAVLDRYGGLKSVRFDPSGFFRLEKKRRWWLVTPDGSAFLSFGHR